MEIQEVLRRWQAGESQRAVARATGLSRNTVEKYVGTAVAAGLQASGPPAAEEFATLAVAGMVRANATLSVVPPAHHETPRS
jgi:hypothetical protein